MIGKCDTCGANITGRSCRICASKKGGRANADKDSMINPRHGLCSYNSYGEYCPLTGSMTTETAGSCSNWLCTYHYSCESPESGRQIIAWAKRMIYKINDARKNPLKTEKIEFKKTAVENAA